LLREDTPGDARLVAYVVTPGEALVAADLRAALKQLLPEYMVPAHLVTLDQLPLTPNGKIDRKALPAPESANNEVAYRAPRTPMEKAIADLWAQVLNLPRVGMDDNFFDLGGHSLLAIRLLNRIRHELNIDLSLRQLFATPTVSGLALAAPGNPAAGAKDRPLSPRA
jgi:acyl carrier protein